MRGLWQFFQGYFWNLLLSIDQLFNALLAGDPDETLCSRVGKYQRAGRGWFPKQFGRFMNLFQKDHCIQAIEDDRGEKF